MAVTVVSIGNVDLGTSPNDGTGSSLRTAFGIVNTNFYSAITNVGFTAANINLTKSIDVANAVTATGGVYADNHLYANGVNIVTNLTNYLTAQGIASINGGYSNVNVSSYLSGNPGGISTGNIVATGTINSPIQVFRPTANASIAIDGYSQRAVIATTGTVPVSFWIDVLLPNVDLDGATVHISSNTAIQLFRVISSNTAATVDVGTNIALPAHSSVGYTFSTVDQKWFKF